MSSSTENTGLRWRLIRRILHRTVTGAARRIIVERTLHTADGQRTRWLRPEIDRYVDGIEGVAGGLRSAAPHLHEQGFGNRLMVELAIYTVASFKRFRQFGLTDDCAKEVIADVGWRVYRRMLGLYSLPLRLISRDPATRLEWTIGLLLRFPFNANEPHGYAVKTWSERGNINTHFTRCPPQAFARAVSEQEGDGDFLDAFYQSWCLYDWPGADLIAGDGRRSHYARPRTLSRGDPVCDMCWIGKVRCTD